MTRPGSHPYQSVLTVASTGAGRRVVYMTPPWDALPSRDGRGELNPIGRWRAYRRRLEALGAEVRIVPSATRPDGGSDDRLFREVFTRDRAFVIGSIAFFPDTSDAALERYGGIDVESEGRTIQAIDRAFRTRLAEDGIRIITTGGHFFETGNFIYDRGSNTLFIGMGRGFDIAAGELSGRDRDQLQAGYIERNAELASFFQRQGINVEFVPLASRRFYHLDTAMMVLPNGELMVYPGALTPAAFARVRQAFEGRTVIELTEAQARGFPANLASVGNTLVPTRISLELRTRLEGLGYRVMAPGEVGPGIEDGFFVDGGIHCITNSVHQPSVPIGEDAAPGRVGPLSERRERDGRILTTVPDPGQPVGLQPGT